MNSLTKKGKTEGMKYRNRLDRHGALAPGRLEVRDGRGCLMVMADGGTRPQSNQTTHGMRISLYPVDVSSEHLHTDSVEGMHKTPIFILQ